MDIDDLFSSPQNLLASAYDHVDEVGVGIRRAFDDWDTRLIVETDVEAGEDIHWVQVIGLVPPQIPVRVFNAVTEIRAALDHAVYASSVALGAREKPRYTAFAFGDDETAFEAEIDRRCGHVPDETVALMRAIKPYKGGNDALWRLNKLRNVKDHRRLLAPLAITQFPNFRAQIRVPDSYNGPRPPQVKWGTVRAPRDYQVPFLSISTGAEMKYNLRCTFDVVFGEPSEVEGLAVMEVLAQGRQAADIAVGFIRAGTLAYLEQRAG